MSEQYVDVSLRHLLNGLAAVSFPSSTYVDKRDTKILSRTEFEVLQCCTNHDDRREFTNS